MALSNMPKLKSTPQIKVSFKLMSVGHSYHYQFSTYQLPCVQDISSHRFSYLNSDKLMSSKRILQEDFRSLVRSRLYSSE